MRCAGCVWLLSLVSYTGRHPKILPLLPDIQDAFSHLLGDSNELTQVSALINRQPFALPPKVETSKVEA